MLKYLTFFIILSINSFAQSSLVTSGNDCNGTAGSVSYSVGQVVFHQITGNGTLIEGVQQPYEISTVNEIKEEKQVSNSISLRPSVDNMILSFEKYSVNNLFFEVTDANGKVFSKKKITNAETLIDFSGIHGQIIFLLIFSENNIVKTYKIIQCI